MQEALLQTPEKTTEISAEKIRGFVKLCIPFSVKKYASVRKIASDLRKSRTSAETEDVQDSRYGFLLKYIQSAFCDNAVCFEKADPHPTFFVSHGADRRLAPIRVEKAEAFVFETRVGILSLQVAFSEDIDEITDICAALRNATTFPILKETAEETALSFDLRTVAQTILTDLGFRSFTLFGYRADPRQERADMFSALLLNEDIYTDDQLRRCGFSLANGYDTRIDPQELNGAEYYYPHTNILWCFSKRGASAIACATPRDKEHLNNRWIVNVQDTYFRMFILALHQKYAIYNYLHAVTVASDLQSLKKYQKEIIEFNTKYVFKIVSDEYFYQQVYTSMVKAMHVDVVYEDLNDELQKLLEYTELNKNNGLSNAAFLLSAVCSVSALIDTYNFFVSEFGFSATASLETVWVFWLALLAEFLLCIVGILFFAKPIFHWIFRKKY